jgi:hypothetical protein
MEVVYEHKHQKYSFMYIFESTFYFLPLLVIPLEVNSVQEQYFHLYFVKFVKI